MDFESRPLYTCPVSSIVQIPDITGLFVVYDKQPTKIYCVPLRGDHDNFFAPEPSPGLRSLCLNPNAIVNLVWIGSCALNGDNICEVLFNEKDFI